MKKQLLITMIVMLPALSFAKVADFNAMIADNAKEQNQLHSTLKASVGEAHEALRERIVVVESKGHSYNAPTRKDLLAFGKEKKSYAPSERKQFDRLANEIHHSED